MGPRFRHVLLCVFVLLAILENFSDAYPQDEGDNDRKTATVSTATTASTVDEGTATTKPTTADSTVDEGTATTKPTTEDSTVDRKTATASTTTIASTVDKETATPNATTTASTADEGTETTKPTSADSTVDRKTATASTATTASTVDEGTATTKPTTADSTVDEGTATTKPTTADSTVDRKTATASTATTASTVDRKTATASTTTIASTVDKETATPNATTTASTADEGTATTKPTTADSTVDRKTATASTTTIASTVDKETATPNAPTTASTADEGTATTKPTIADSTVDRKTATASTTTIASTVDKETATPNATTTASTVDEGTATTKPTTADSTVDRKTATASTTTIASTVDRKTATASTTTIASTVDADKTTPKATTCEQIEDKCKQEGKICKMQEGQAECSDTCPDNITKNCESVPYRFCRVRKGETECYCQEGLRHINERCEIARKVRVTLTITTNGARRRRDAAESKGDDIEFEVFAENDQEVANVTNSLNDCDKDCPLGLVSFSGVKTAPAKQCGQLETIAKDFGMKCTDGDGNGTKVLCDITKAKPIGSTTLHGIPFDVCKPLPCNETCPGSDRRHCVGESCVCKPQFKYDPATNECKSICDFKPSPCYGEAVCEAGMDYQSFYCRCPPKRTGPLCQRDNKPFLSAQLNIVIVGVVLSSLLLMCFVVSASIISRLKKKLEGPSFKKDPERSTQRELRGYDGPIQSFGPSLPTPREGLHVTMRALT
ncbi:hypothetical protein MTO96_012148 [Rhipicephalus appendiculatus]